MTRPQRRTGNAKPTMIDALSIRCYRAALVVAGYLDTHWGLFTVSISGYQAALGTHTLGDYLFIVGHVWLVTN